MKNTKVAIFWTIAALCWSSSALAITTSLTSITPSALVTNSPDITFEFVSDEPDAFFMCSLDYQEPVRCTSPWTYRNIADGKHHFKVFAISPGAGLDRSGSTHEWLIDTVAPTTTMNTNPAGQDTYAVYLLSSETQSTFLCALNSAPLSYCLSTHLLENLLPGNYTFKAFAKDEAGNIDPIGAHFSFSVLDRTPLTTTITGVNPNTPYTNITQITFDFVSSHASAKFVCSLAGTTNPCQSPFQYNSLPDNNYLFKVQAVDASGNMDPIGATYSWTVDTTPPVAALTRLDSTSTIVTVSWTTNEPSTTELNWGAGADLSRKAPSDATLKTNHTVQITGLSSYSPYSVQPAGVDRAGNPFQMDAQSVRTKR